MSCINFWPIQSAKAGRFHKNQPTHLVEKIIKFQINPLSIFFNWTHADDYTAEPNSTIIGWMIAVLCNWRGWSAHNARGRWSTTDHLISSRSLGRSQCLCISYSSWTVFVTIYPMQFLSWLDSKASWHSIFSPSDLHQEGWCPTDHLISTSAKPLGHTQFFQKYFLQFSKCISQYQPNAFLLLINSQIHLTHLPGRSFTWSADFPPGSNIWLFRADKYQPIMFVCHPGSR